MRRAAVLVGLAAAVVATLGALERPVRADRADQLFKKGKKLLAEKRYPEACTAFEDSDRLDPGIGAKLNVAKCYEEWGRLATAWRWYTDAERMATDAHDERARKIHALIAELDDSVPRLTIKAAAHADTTGVVVKLDGVALDVHALGAERRVDPGPHTIEYVVSGHAVTKVVPLERGGSSEILLDLPTGPSHKAAEPQPVAAEDDRVRTRRMIGLGVSGAGALAIGIAGIVTLRAHGDYEHALSAHCRDSKDMCDALGLSATQSARRRANLATGFTIGGVAAIAGGLAVYFLAPRAAAHAQEHALYLVPSAGDGGGGVVFGGAF
ncbi:MAG TPA: hypothetical protein VFT22_38340 [Kofleriaceae bacterium]|nr:hypothetical protein [Kofleriaceae bacterium]